MQSVQTRWLGPTNSRGSRVKAFSEAFPRGVTIPWDYALGVEDNHRAAARAFIESKGWHGTWVGGGAADSRGMVFVCLTRVFKRVTVGAGRGIIIGGALAFNLHRHEPLVGEPVLRPGDLDGMTHVIAATCLADMRDLLVCHNPTEPNEPTEGTP